MRLFFFGFWERSQTASTWPQVCDFTYGPRGSPCLKRNLGYSLLTHFKVELQAAQAILLKQQPIFGLEESQKKI